MARIVITLLLALVIGGGWLGISLGKSRVIDELVQASQNKDAAAFAARVDWDAVRDFVKKDLKAQKSSPIGASMGPPADRIDSIVDYYLEPDSVEILYYWHDSVFSGVPERDFIVGTGFSPLFGFSLTVGLPENIVQENANARAMRDRLKVRAVFRLDGLTWKIKELHVPLFMVPQQTHPVPAVKIYGDPKRKP